jgi:hypothetical protein
MRAKFPAQHILPPVVSSISGENIHLSIAFSNSHSLSASLNANSNMAPAQN